MMRCVMWWCTVCSLLGASAVAAQPQVYRCDNALYTNQPPAAQQCVPLTGGAITVIEGTRVNGQAAGQTPAAAPGAAPGGSSDKVAIPTQQQRDAQALVVLQAELQKAQARHAQLLQTWNQGEPAREPIEFKQPAKYQERLAQLRQALQRSEADVLGLQREVARLNPATAGAKP